MIDRMFWKIGLCDLCIKDKSVLQLRLKGIMENGKWVGGYSEAKSRIVKELHVEWEKEIRCPCLVFQADMDEVVICEKHLAEAMSQKSQYLDAS